MGDIYAALGPELLHLKIEAHCLVRCSSIVLPAEVQYAWPDPSGRRLYVAASNDSPKSRRPAPEHFLLTVDLDDVGTPQLRRHAVALPCRPIHVTLDGGTHAVCTYNKPSGITVHPIADDGSPGAAIDQPQPDLRLYAHQARTTPGDDLVLVCARGYDASSERDEQPGAIHQLRYDSGRIGTPLMPIEPAGGYGFGPRHIDFHPQKPIAYVSLERQNEIWGFELGPSGLSVEPAFRADTIDKPGLGSPDQIVGAIKVHPNGRFLYAANRARTSVRFAGDDVFGGGDNSMVVFALDGRSGEPQLIQRIGTRGIMPRTFALDAARGFLVTANQSPMKVRTEDGVELLPASLVVYAIGEDGRLTFRDKLDVEADGETLFWVGTAGAL